jgi:hypothetical protein
MVLSGKPCVDNSSFECGDHWREVTWEWTLREFVRAPVEEDQKWMVWSAEPPPVARRDVCQGHHARACRSVCGFERREGDEVNGMVEVKREWDEETYLDGCSVVSLCPLGRAFRHTIFGCQY